MTFNANANGTAHRRSNPFARTPSASPATNTNLRPKSAIFSSPSSTPGLSTPLGHSRTQSNGSLSAITHGFSGSAPRQQRSDSKSGTPTSTTFAPSFIKTEEMKRHDTVKGIEGENDFSGKRYVWLKDPQAAFVRGWIVEEMDGNRLLVQCDDGTVSISR